MNILSEMTSITYHDNVLKYDIIRKQVDKIKAKLTNHILQSDDVVAVALHRSPVMLSTLIALLEIKVTFMPIDIHLPEARINRMIQQVNAKYCINDGKCIEGLVNINAEEDIGSDIDGAYCCCNSDIAYIMCTSGTTGLPKSVMIKRSGLENFVQAIPKIITFEAGRSMTCLTSCSFDIFLLESVMAAYLGLNIILADDVEAENAACLTNLMKNADYIQMTPSKMNLIQMIDKEFECLRKTKVIMLGGEAFPENLLKTLRAKTTAEIYNMYGPVETTIWSSVARLTDSSFVNIGYPIDGTEFFILNEEHEILPDGRIGEIAISGEGVAAGYKGDEELTSKKFICLSNGKQVYLTGDLGKKNVKGFYECGGRIDTQVKIRGFRVELEEIESCITQYFEGVLPACVYVQKGESSELVVLYTCDEEISNNEFNETISQYLPYYMIPNKYLRVDKIIYTTSFKIDRRAMKEIFLSSIDVKNDFEVVKNDVDSEIYAVIGEIVEYSASQIGYGVKLKDIGVDSLKLIMLIVSLEEKYEIEFHDQMLSRNMFYYCGELCDYVKALIEQKEK